VLRALPATVLGSDVRGDAVAFAIDNARAAGIGHLLRFHKRGVRDFEPPEGPPGVIVCNPPYGERIGEEKDLRGLYQLLGEVFSRRCRGWTAHVFTGNPRLAAAIGLAPVAQVPLYNGKIPCRLLKFELAGGRGANG
jgi:putative N6-adenine-specific DNA methylase